MVASLKNITKKFGNEVVLKNVSLEVASGDVYGLLGPNGAGKTTLIRILLGLLKPTGGELYLFDEPINFISRKQFRMVGVVLDKPGLYDNLTAEKNLEFYCRLFRVEPRETRINEILDIIGLTNQSKKLVANFSKGMKQRLALGRAMLHDPQLLILDEPMNGLDIDGTHIFQNLLSDFSQEGRTIIINSHNLRQVDQLCNKIGVLNEGRLMYNGSKDTLLNRNIVKTIHISLTSDLKAEEICINIQRLPFVKAAIYKKQILSITYYSQQEGVDEILSLIKRLGGNVKNIRSQNDELEEVLLPMLKEPDYE